MKETNTKNEVGKKDKEVRKIPAFGGKGPSRIRQSFGRGLTIFLVIAACIILYFAFLRADTLFSVAGTIIEILKPIIYGFAIAYLLNPIVKETAIFQGGRDPVCPAGSVCCDFCPAKYAHTGAFSQHPEPHGNIAGTVEQWY